MDQRKGRIHEDHCMHREPGVTICTCQPLCPESELRAGMTDPEFWEHVLLRPEERGRDYKPDIEDLVEITNQSSPCPECGQTGPCAYDADGRPMIHLTEDDET